MNKLLKKMSWKYNSGRWNKDEVIFDLIGFALIGIAIGIYVWLAHNV